MSSFIFFFNFQYLITSLNWDFNNNIKKLSYFYHLIINYSKMMWFIVEKQDLKMVWYKQFLLDIYIIYY